MMMPGKQSTARKRILRWILAGSSPVILLLVLFYWSIWRAISPYSNRAALLSAMLTLQMTGEDIVTVGGRSDVLLVRRPGQNQAIDDYLAQTGWGRVDWMGGIGQARKGNQKLRVVNAGMTSFFRIIGLGHSPYSTSTKHDF